MVWAAIDSFCKWANQRKELLAGIVGVAIEEAVQFIPVPGLGLACRLLGEVGVFGASRLMDKRAAIPDVKEAGQEFPKEQIDQINAWLETLTKSYASLLDRPEPLAGNTANKSAEELTALVKRTLVERADLAQEFDAHLREVRQATLSLSRIEEKLDRNFHETNRVAAGLEDLKAA